MKYEFTGEVRMRFGVRLHQIRALVAIASIGVAAGDVGGWIEKETSLSQDGNAWVSGNAWVYGNARVYGDAHVYGDAQVSGNAQVYGDAQVYGNAWVYGNARVSGKAWVSGDKLIFWATKVGRENATLTVYNGTSGLIVSRGCFCGSVDEFLSKSAAEHDDDTHWEYVLLIEVASSRINRGIAEAKANGITA